MKKIYAGSDLAVVVLDTPEEIEAVSVALRYRLRTLADRTSAALLAEMEAPAPA